MQSISKTKKFISSSITSKRSYCSNDRWVNDVIALRKADCSITFPEASDVAKQVSQIVLLNSDFSVLKDVLMEGRRVVNNITNVATIFFIKHCIQ